MCHKFAPKSARAHHRFDGADVRLAGGARSRDTEGEKTWCVSIFIMRKELDIMWLDSVCYACAAEMAENACNILICREV
jgi:hypothetical protein